MVCPKCNRKYEDDMPRCLWCDAPNLNYGKNEKEIPAHEELKPTVLEQKASSKGTLVFWLTVFGGECGLHHFATGNYLKGIAYLLFGIFTYSFLNGYFGMFAFPLHFYLIAPAFVVTIRFLCFCDLWNISQGKFFNKRKKITYGAAKWMKIMVPVIGCFYLLVSAGECLNQLANYRMIGQKRLETIMQTYVDCQEKFFTQNKKMGTVDEIGFALTLDINTNYFTYKEIENGIEIENQTSYGTCHSNSKWTITVKSSEDLNWQVNLPEEIMCETMFPKITEYKKKIGGP